MKKLLSMKKLLPLLLALALVFSLAACGSKTDDTTTDDTQGDANELTESRRACGDHCLSPPPP